MNQQLTVVDQEYMPLMTNQQAKQRYQAFKDFVTDIMRPGVDYGVIPGTNKPTLLKPGAEKLATFFGLTVHFESVQIIEDWTGEQHGGEPLFYYWYRCVLMRNGQFVADAEGSCNSREAKYRWRDSKRKCPSCGQSAIIKGRVEYGGGWVCFAKKGGCGAKFREDDTSITGQLTGRAPNEDIADAVNTIQKMAQKRALVAATLIGTNASEYFTQDVEDYIDAEPVESKQDRNDRIQAQATLAQHNKAEASTKTTEDTQAPATSAPAPDAAFWRTFCKDHGFSKDDIQAALGSQSVVTWMNQQSASIDDAMTAMRNWAQRAKQTTAGK